MPSPTHRPLIPHVSLACAAALAFSLTAAHAQSITNLGVLQPDHQFSMGTALSATGNVVTGVADTPGAEHAFIWSPANGMQTLPSVGIEPAGGYCINADGSVIAGYSGLFASRWVNGSPESLGTVPGGSFSVAYSISGNGQFVGGVSDNADGDALAFLWSSSLGMVDLNTYLPSLGVDLSNWTLTTTTGISFDGRVLTGTGTFDGEERGWVATIPAPSAASLLALGGLLASRRRR